MEGKVRPALVVSVGCATPTAPWITHPPAHHQPSRFPIRDCRQCPFLEGWRVPGTERRNLSERKRDLEVGNAQTRSVQSRLRRASSLARRHPGMKRKGLAVSPRGWSVSRPTPWRSGSGTGRIYSRRRPTNFRGIRPDGSRLCGSAHRASAAAAPGPVRGLPVWESAWPPALRCCR